ncbi:MAG: aminotransferase class V-fold PLP-dependent enzyme [Candidatus Krumholzibacteriia bacterium]
MNPSRGGGSDEVVYLDNAATSWPKPPGVVDAVTHYLRAVGANPGRAGHHRAAEAGRLVLGARMAVARLFGARNPMRVVFGPNATWGLNLAIQGLLHPGDHVVTTAMEHNSVMRPLRWLSAERGVVISKVTASPDGVVDPDDVVRAMHERTALVVVCHASNVCGAVQDIAAVGAACRARGVPLLVDAAQSAGAVPLDLAGAAIDLLAFAGHKGLLGPTGTGGLVIADSFDPGRLRPLVFGGTGSRSDSTEQPDALPDRFESGTLDVAGLAGLAAGLAWLQEQGGPAAIGAHETSLRRRFLDAARAEVPGFRWYGPADVVGVISFNVDGWTPSDLGDALSERYGILGRQGLHCAPTAHRSLGTFPAGSLRFGFGPFNTESHVDRAVAGLVELGRRRRP